MPRICILSLSTIADDPRVRRQGDAFADAGWDIVAVGLPGAKSPAPTWPILAANGPALEQPAAERQRSVLQGLWAAGDGQIRYRIYRAVQNSNRAFGLSTRILGWFQSGLLHVFKSLRRLCKILRAIMIRVNPGRGPDRYLAVPEIRRFYDSARHIHADIFLANDWHMLPPAMRLAREHGTCFAYDTHEYALEEYRYNPAWRLTLRPMAEAIERIGLRGALVASTVSSGIARDMGKEYQLERPLLVFRNTPAREDVAFRPCGERIDVLYHGIIVQDRGLEDCVRSVQLWRREFRLILRGPSEPTFRVGLERIAETEGVRDRVVFAPPVPMLELVRVATTADIGISTPPRTSKHNIYALPNKFFEYIQAGLALCVCDLPDMAEIVRQYDLGLLIGELSPQGIAAAINRFDRQSIDAFKRNSLKAARDLNWDVESARFVNAYEQALGMEKPAAGIVVTALETAR
jgi:glycosyltransferase involved in cell wall biosynthesis